MPTGHILIYGKQQDLPFRLLALHRLTDQALNPCLPPPVQGSELLSPWKERESNSPSPRPSPQRRVPRRPSLGMAECCDLS